MQRSLTYPYGATPTITVEFTVDDILTDPTTITLVVQDPDGTDSTYVYSLGQLTRTAQGCYEKAITFNKAGNWAWRWVATGAVEAVIERRAYVEPSVVV